jgi:hypothetical protein
MLKFLKRKDIELYNLVHFSVFFVLAYPKIRVIFLENRCILY